MSVSLKPSHLKRYKDIALLFMKYGRGDVLREAGLEDDLVPGEQNPESVAKAEDLAADLEALGPTFVKLGQLLSTRAEFIPQSYLDALTRLQDHVAPFSYDEVEQIVTEELGVRITKAFAEFDAVPLAAASLGQVHRAVLRDGRAVVVKVQRPNIRETIVEDLEALAEITAVLDKRTKAGARYNFTAMIEEFRRSLMAELDYRAEARNLTTMADSLAGFERLVVPRPVTDYSSGRVLTMEYVAGNKITSLGPLALMEIDGPGLAEELFKAYLKQVFLDGFFHADPHPGNVFVTDDGRVALLDLGMVASLAPRMQEHLLQLVLAVSEGRSDEAVDTALMIGERQGEFSEKEFRRRIGNLVVQQHGRTVGEMQVGRLFLDLARDAGDTGLRMPPELTLLGKTLLNLDLIGRTLAPDFDPAAAIRDQAAKLMRQRMLQQLSPGNVFNNLLEVKDLVTRLPARVNRILDAAANNQLGFKLDTGIDPAHLMVGLQKVANRIAIGLLLASLIVGAAMLMQVRTAFTILGYPGFAMIFFLAAVSGGLLLLLQIVLTDIRSRPKSGQLPGSPLQGKPDHS